MRSSTIKEYIRSIVLEALEEDKFADIIKAHPALGNILKIYFKETKPKYLPWLAKILERQLKQERFPPNRDDFIDLKKLLDDFDKLAAKNKIKEKDINKYNWATLRDAIETADVPSETDIRKAAKTQAKKVYEDDEYLLVQPLSKEASIYYGKGTRWCVSSLHDNAFDSYTENDGYFIFLINKKTNDKDALSLDKKNKRFGSVFNNEDTNIGMLLPGFGGSGGRYILDKYPDHIIKELEKVLKRKKKQ